MTGVGAAIGNMVLPGLGGAAGGALAAHVVDALTRESPRKKRVFVSFDFDNDQGLKHLLIGQSRHAESPFDVADWSLKEAAPEANWKTKASRAIGQADLVVILLGRETYRAPGVLEEVRMARAADKQVVQLIGNSAGSYRRVPNAGRVMAWTWPNLKNLFS